MYRMYVHMCMYAGYIYYMPTWLALSPKNGTELEVWGREGMCV